METFRHTSHGTSFSLQADPAMATPAQMLLRAIDTIPPEEIRDGYTFEVGFSVFTCLQEKDGYRLLSPDYRTSPLTNTTEDLSVALWVLLEQALLLKQCGVSGVPVRFDDELVIAAGALDGTCISLQRFSELGKDASGWCIEAWQETEGGIVPAEASSYQAIYAYELLQKRPALIKVLALPFEHMAIFRENKLIAALNEKNEDLL